MHAVVVKVTINDPESGLRAAGACGAPSRPGSRVRDGSLDAQPRTPPASQVRTAIPAGVTLEEVEVREVVANAWAVAPTICRNEGHTGR
jgi:hypothetical protein